MLEGIRYNDIIVGAYTGRWDLPDAGRPPGGRADDLISFAKAWDRFAFRGARVAAARRATRASCWS